MRFRVELVDPQTGDRTVAGEHSTEGEAVRQILNITQLCIIELRSSYALLARIDNKRAASPSAPADFRMAAE